MLHILPIDKLARILFTARVGGVWLAYAISNDLLLTVWEFGKFHIFQIVVRKVRKLQINKKSVPIFLQFPLHKFEIFWNLHQPKGVLSPRLTRSDLKKLNYFSFSSFFGDLCLKVFGKLLKQSNITKPKHIWTKSQS